jgi:hypothetical protein
MPTVERYKLPLSTAVTADRFVFEFLRDGSSRDMKVDGSVTPVNFIEDGNIAPSKFGGVSALSNGCLIKALDTDGSTVIKDFMDGETIKTHWELALLAGVDVEVDAGAGDDVVPIRWTIAKAGATLLLETSQRIRFTVQDDLTNLSNFYAMVQGKTNE